MLELLRTRMMTLQTVALGAIAYAETKGVDILKLVGDIIEAGSEGGAIIIGAIGTALALLQNALNKNKQ